MDDRVPPPPPGMEALPAAARPASGSAAVATVPAGRWDRPAPADAPRGGAKETIEQILIAFILAFIFRCFIVEAFVIPTGSMATTLLGAHMSFRCPDCGYRFAVDFPSAQGNDIVVPDRANGKTYPIRCPNCAYLFPPTSTGDAQGTAKEPSVLYGDRILVQKYLYLLNDPQRWDVVVFKSPYDDEGTRKAGDRYMQNYIKRLIGKPGETIVVLDGDVYVAERDAPVETLGPEDFKVQTKPWAAQQALWRVVYDNDFHPRGLPRTYGDQADSALREPEAAWKQPWTATRAGWETSGRSFKVDANADGAELRYDFSGSMAAKYPLTDWLSYDVTRGAGGGTQWGTDTYADPADRNPVSDVMLAVTYRRDGGAGPLRLKTTKRTTEFVAEVTPGGATLTMQRADGQPVTIGSVQRAGLGSGAGTRLELCCVDYRVFLRIDGQEALSTTPAQFSPDIAALLTEHRDTPSGDLSRFDALRPTVRIEAIDQRAELTHVSLWRDVYYLNQMGRKPILWASPLPLAKALAGESHSASDWSRPVRLGKDEYFVMGDNSFMSLDARLWTDPIDLTASEDLRVQAGRVPGRFLLGKAFFVYWPAGYKPPIVPLAIVPNAGQIRFIH